MPWHWAQESPACLVPEARGKSSSWLAGAPLAPSLWQTRQLAESCGPAQRALKPATDVCNGASDAALPWMALTPATAPTTTSWQPTQVVAVKSATKVLGAVVLYWSWQVRQAPPAAPECAPLPTVNPLAPLAWAATRTRTLPSSWQRAQSSDEAWTAAGVVPFLT